MNFLYRDGVVEEIIRRKQRKCPLCGSTRVSAYRRGTRIVTGLPIGCKTFWLHFDVHTITCSTCGKQTPERIPFLKTPTLRLTRLQELLKQGNGYRNDEFFKQRIYDLPDRKIIDLTSPSPPKPAEMKRQSVWHSISYQF